MGAVLQTRTLPVSISICISPTTKKPGVGIKIFGMLLKEDYLRLATIRTVIGMAKTVIYSIYSATILGKLMQNFIMDLSQVFSVK